LNRRAKALRVIPIVLSVLLLGSLGTVFLLTDISLEQRPGAATVERAFADRRSDLWLEATGVVWRELPDDTDPPRHQRFILELDSGHTVLVAHNIDIAPRVPLEVGDRLAVRGEYEWNERGGVIHWTHRDETGRRRGGWVRFQGVHYR
jgi:hypothetical protein